MFSDKFDKVEYFITASKTSTKRKFPTVYRRFRFPLFICQSQWVLRARRRAPLVGIEFPLSTNEIGSSRKVGQNVPLLLG